MAPWCHATPHDLEGLDFEIPIAGATSADAQELSELFRAAIQGEEVAGSADTAAAHVFSMLSAVTGMHLKPTDRHEPFGPMVVLAEGRRSAIPADFRGDQVDVLAKLAQWAKHPVLRARLSDLSWLLDRKRAELGSLAIAAYVEIVRKIDAGELKYRFERDDSALNHRAIDYLRRALQIGWSIGWDKPEAMSARNLAIALRERATSERALVPVLWFGQLDLEFGLSDPEKLGHEIDTAFSNLPSDTSAHIVVDLRRLAASAYHSAKRDADKNRCLSEAAERLAFDAESVLTNQKSTFLASGCWLIYRLCLLPLFPYWEQLRLPFN